MAGRLQWDGEKAKRLIAREINRRVEASAIAVANHAKELVNAEGTARSPGKKAGGKKRKGAIIYGANPSQPGEPPHKQTGRLLGSIAWEVVRNVARVGTNLDYGRWLELGTRKMAARPWLRRALREMTAKVRAILSRPITFR